MWGCIGVCAFRFGLESSPLFPYGITCFSLDFFWIVGFVLAEAASNQSLVHLPSSFLKELRMMAYQESRSKFEAEL